MNASTLSQVVKNVGHVVDESNDGAADGDDNVDKNENVVDEHVDDGLCVEVHLLGHRPVEVGVHKDDRQLHKIDTFQALLLLHPVFITMLDGW